MQGQALSGFSVMAVPEETRRKAVAELWAFAAAGELRPRIFTRFPLAKAADAHRAMASRQTMGKVVVEV